MRDCIACLVSYLFLIWKTITMDDDFRRWLKNLWMIRVMITDESHIQVTRWNQYERDLVSYKKISKMSLDRNEFLLVVVNYNHGQASWADTSLAMANLSKYYRCGEQKIMIFLSWQPYNRSRILSDLLLLLFRGFSQVLNLLFRFFEHAFIVVVIDSRWVE